VARQADDVNMPLVKLPVGTMLTFKRDPQEQRSLLNAFALENYYTFMTVNREVGSSVR
jgi:hypothetical protein